MKIRFGRNLTKFGVLTMQSMYEIDNKFRWCYDLPMSGKVIW